MTERLIAKLDRLANEAGIKDVTPEIYRFAQLLNDDKLKQWDEWRQQRTWVGLTDEEISEFDTWHDNREEEVGWCSPLEIVAYIENKLKEKNT